MYEIREFLLRSVFQYYPVGMPALRKGHYSGLLLIQEIIGNKINNLLAANTTNHTLLLGELKEFFPMYVVEDYSYFQFPNYVIFIEDRNFKEYKPGIKMVIKVFISLLVPSYTVFIQERKLAGLDEDNLEDYLRNIYPESKAQEYSNIITPIKEKVEKYFSTMYVNHSLLMSTYVDGSSPWGENDNAIRPYSLFQYLYGHIF